MGSVKTHIDDEAIATVTLSNPARYNAMQLSMWQSLRQTMLDLSANQSVRVVILRGEGDRAFVSGADISEFDTLRSDSDHVQAYNVAVDQAEQAIIACTKPTVAAISGICFGGGLGLALCCDLRFASETSTFCLPAAKLGLGYGLENIRRMQHILGVANTYELLLTAQTFNHVQALNLGMIHAYDQDVFTLVIHHAKNMSALAPLTLASIKLSMRHLYGGSRAPDLQSVQSAVQSCFESQDYAEGRDAFKQKRKPKFQGR